MKRLKRSIVAAIAVFVAVFYAVPAPTALAESSALSIAPKKNYVIEPGKSVNDTLVIRNLDNASDLELSLRVVDFSYTDNTGTPKLFLDQNAPQTTWSLKPFVSVPRTVTVKPGTSESVKIDVAIPSNQGAGSFYSAILYSTGAPDGGNVGLSASGVTLVFVTVPGEVDEKLTLTKLGAYQDAGVGKEAKYLFITADMPQKIAYTLKNDGNVTESPVGSITLRGMFGNEIVIEDVNPTGSLALIGQERTFTTCIKLKSEQVELNGNESSAVGCADPGLWPGLYTVDLDIYYGQNGNLTQQILGNATFWYLPWWFVITALVVLLVVGYFVWRLVTKIRGAIYGSKFKGSRRRR